MDARVRARIGASAPPPSPSGPTYVSLFTGAGGLDMAVHDLWPDADLQWWSEVDEHAAEIFARTTDAPNLGDITAIDWASLKEDLMAGKRKDAKAEAAYERYQDGLSLSQVAEEFGCTRQSIHGLFTTRGYALRPPPEPKPYVEFNGRRYTMRDSIGYLGATTKPRTLLHRDVWEFHRGLIPEGYEIHHKDHDPTNNELSNLEMLTKADHARLHAAIAAEEVMPQEAAPIDMIVAGFP